MGEIADMMLGGEMCAMCGAEMDAGDMGIPMYCSQECANDQGADGEDAQVVQPEQLI